MELNGRPDMHLQRSVPCVFTTSPETKTFFVDALGPTTSTVVLTGWLRIASLNFNGVFGCNCQPWKNPQNPIYFIVCTCLYTLILVLYLPLTEPSPSFRQCYRVSLEAGSRFPFVTAPCRTPQPHVSIVFLDFVTPSSLHACML